MVGNLVSYTQGRTQNTEHRTQKGAREEGADKFSFIYGLFNDAFNASDYSIASSDRTIGE
jgi:hypothetical protein